MSCTTRLSTSACSQPNTLESTVEREHQYEHHLKGVEVDALAGMQVHAGEEVGLLVVALGTEALDDLLLGGARGQRLGDHTLEDEVGRLAEQLRAEHGEDHAHGAEQHDEHDLDAVRHEPAEQALRRRKEGHRLLGGHAHPAERAAAHGTAPRRRALGGVGAHAASCALSWDSTISA